MRKGKTIGLVLALGGVAAGVLGVNGWAQAAIEGSGLPLPRFVSLRADEVNMRAGPGVQYPIDWVYQREKLPLEVIAEHKTWRRVRDWQGTQGWIHQSMLGGTRTVIVTGKTRSLRSEPDTKSAPMARAEPGVIGRLKECPASNTWCRIEIEGYEGWLRRVDFWGVYRHEVVR